MLQIFKDVAGVDTVSRAWKCANPREIKNHWTSLYDLNIKGAKVLVQKGGGGGEGGKNLALQYSVFITEMKSYVKDDDCIIHFKKE